MTKVSSITFRSGDVLLFRRGDVWSEEELILRGSGDYFQNGKITVDAYGEGSRPRITNPPFDLTPGLVAWQVVNEAYPGTNREFMKIAVKLEGHRWIIRGLEIDTAEMGIYALETSNGSVFEDLYIHHIQGLFYPPPPCWGKNGCDIWSPKPEFGSAIQVSGEDVTVQDITVSDSTGGISGFAAVGLIENVFLDKILTGGLSYAGFFLTIRNATVLNPNWPTGAWYGADPFISVGDVGVTLENSEMAYNDPHENGGDSSALDIDVASVNVVVQNNFIHNNVGSCMEFNLTGPNRRIRVENNICYNNGLGVNGDHTPSYLTAAFSADGCAYPGTSYEIWNNKIYKAFPGQFLNWYFNDGVRQSSNDFSFALQNFLYTVYGNEIFEHGTYSFPLLVSPPPPIDRENLARSAEVSVSSGSNTAAFAKDGLISTEWVSNESMPSIRYTFDSAQEIDTVRIFDRPDLNNWATSGVLSFSDGSRVNITGGILNNGAMREVVLREPKRVAWVQFAVTRNQPTSPGTQVGLSEFQVYAAGPRPIPSPTPLPGQFSVNFADESSGAPEHVVGRFPDTPEGIDWKDADWRTALDPDTGRSYLFIDFPAIAGGHLDGWPSYITRVFILPKAKRLKSVTLYCVNSGVGGTVYVGQSFNQQQITCPAEGTQFDFSWTQPPESDQVGVLIDFGETGGSVTDLRIADIAYGD